MRKLNFEEIKSVTLGAVRITKEEDGIHFYRFTEEQENLYRERNKGFYIKTFASSGIEFFFETDSKELDLKAEVSPYSRSYYSIEVHVNGVRVGSLDNFTGALLPECYTTVSLPVGKTEGRFDLGEGVKEVRVFLPWSAKTTILEFSLSDGATLCPIKPKNKLLAFGDSITQGYDALYPSNKYITKLCAHLDAQEFNKAIGGEVMFPELAATKEDFVPDYITVAYGTNDWSKTDSELFEKNGALFFKNLCANYPDSKIFMITPLWRKNYLMEKPFGAFEKVSEILHRIAAKHPEITVVDGWDLVEHDSKFFADLTLHPNDEGFGLYYEGLKQKIDQSL